MGPFIRLPLHPFMLAAYAVLLVYAANIDEMLPVDLVGPMGRSLAAAAIALVVAVLLYGNFARGAFVASALVVAALYFGQVAPQLATLGLDEPSQLVAWVAAVGLVAAYAARARASVPRMTAALNVFGIALLLMSLATIVPFETGRATRASQRSPADAADLPRALGVPGRDIYFLVFDRYGSNWSLDHRFGIESDLPGWLAQHGFQVIPGARANYRATDLSLASILGMRYLDDLSESFGRSSSDREPVRARLLDHEVGRFLEANGYRYYQLGTWWEGTRSSSIADEVLTLGTTTELDSALGRVSLAAVLQRLVGSGSTDTAFREGQRDNALFELRQVERLAGVPGRKFVFAHVLLPHPPYVFHADGSDLLDSEAERRPEAELYAEQLAYTNTRVRELVTTLTAGPDDEDPIIVLTADEGPYLCSNLDYDDCMDGSPESLGIRYGTLRAYFLPGIDYTVPSDDSGVNIFRMLFREYFGVDLPDLPNRSYTWPDDDHVYDFRDVTDQLPLPVD